MVAFIKNFLHHRSIQVRANGTLSNPTAIQNGVPQGSVISVTLFLVGINNIMENIPPPIQGHLFADDLTLTCSGRNIKTVIKLLQTTINKLQTWSEQSGLRLSPQKTQYIIFSRQRKQNQNLPKLYIENIEVKKVDNIKLLGLTFDSKLTWVPYMKHLKNTYTKKMNVIKTLANSNWGADQETILKTYQAMIRSQIDYGSIVYNSAKPNTLKMIDTIHYTALRIATGTYRTSPINSILFEAKEPPLDQRRKFLSLKYTAKMSSTPNNPTYNYVFGNRYTPLLNKKPKLPMPFYGRINKYRNLVKIMSTLAITRSVGKIAPWTIQTPKIDVTLANVVKDQKSSLEHRVDFLQLDKKYPNCVKLYTDASKTDQGVGIAIICDNMTRKLRLPNASSIFSAEAYAVLKALHYIQSQNLQHAVIYTDSISVINAIENTGNKNKHDTILNIQEIYTDLIHNGKQVILIWVPSHQGIIGNEKADTAAKEAASHSPNEVEGRIPYQDLVTSLKHAEKQEWNIIWTTSKKTKTHDTVQDFYQPMPSAMTRRERIIMARLRTGHCRLTHEYLIKKTDPPFCNVCDQPLSTNHMLYECRRFQTSRQKYNIEKPTALTAPECTDATLNYLKEINMYKEI
ncbi:uncharacterized protein LOC143344561 [Colletes latitarsis]|uniref:uncharacterized protein LOC143344561 n=1 Tax=Colletes latitarsis TaxID=2605962 RepID=UPI004036DAE2